MSAENEMRTASNPEKPALLLARNTIWSFSTNLLGSALAFFLVPFLLRKTGDAAYGVWILIGSIFGYSSLMQAGMSSAVNREVPLLLVQSDSDGLRRVVSTSTAFYAFIGLSCLALTAFIYWRITRWIVIPIALVSQVECAVLIIGVALSAGMAAQGLGAVVSGYQRYDLLALARIIPLGLRALALLAALQYTNSLVAIAAIYALTDLSSIATCALFAYRLLPPNAISCAWVSFALFGRMLAYGLNTILYSLGSILLLKTSEIIIGILLTPEKVTLYALAAGLVLTLTGLVEAFCGALKPMVTHLHTRQDHGKVKEVALRTQKLVLLFALPSCALLLIMGVPLLEIWVHKRNSELAFVLGLLSIGHLLRVAQFSNFLVLVGIGQHRVFGWLTIATGVTTGLLSVLAINLGYGIVGVAAANLVALGIFNGIVLPRHFARKLRITTKEWFRRVLAPALLASLPGALTLLAWRLLDPPSNWGTLIPVVAIGGVAFLLGLWRFGGIESEVQMAIHLLMRRPISRQLPVRY